MGLFLPTSRTLHFSLLNIMKFLLAPVSSLRALSGWQRDPLAFQPLLHQDQRRVNSSCTLPTWTRGTCEEWDGVLCCSQHAAGVRLVGPRACKVWVCMNSGSLRHEAMPVGCILKICIFVREPLVALTVLGAKPSPLINLTGVPMTETGFTVYALGQRSLFSQGKAGNRMT